MSKQKIILLVVVIVVIVAVGIILAIPKGEKEGEGTAEEGASTEGVTQTPEEIKKIVEKIIKAEDASLCEGIKGEKDRERCDILADAIVREDISVCDNIKDDKKVRMICKDNIVIILAISAKSPSSCERLADKTRIDECKSKVVPESVE